MVQKRGYPKADAVKKAILTTQGITPLELRQALFDYASTVDETTLEKVPEDIRPYIQKVVLHAYKVTDKDMAALKALGYTEEHIFEITVASVVGTATRRLNKALSVLEESDAN